MSLTRTSSTHQLGSVATWTSSSLALAQGPSWPTWENFRQAGVRGLESVPKHTVATLQTKKGVFRVMHDDDFRSLIGIASGVLQFQKAFKAIQQSVNLVSKHPDQEHIQLLVEHVSVFAESPMIDLFLGFLANDMRSNPERATPLSQNVLERAQKLTSGVVVDDNEVIPDDITL